MMKTKSKCMITVYEPTMLPREESNKGKQSNAIRQPSQKKKGDIIEMIHNR